VLTADDRIQRLWTVMEQQPVAGTYKIKVSRKKIPNSPYRQNRHSFCPGHNSTPEKSAHRRPLTPLSDHRFNRRLAHPRVAEIRPLLSQLAPSTIVEADEWQACYCYFYQTTRLPATEPTIQELLLIIAKPGGFLDRKNSGPPGSTTLWRGLHRLHDIVSFTLFRKVKQNLCVMISSGKGLGHSRQVKIINLLITIN
jgi:hypothetical protein